MKEINMSSEALIKYISEAEKRTPVKIYLKSDSQIQWENCTSFSMGEKGKILFGDWRDLEPQLEKHHSSIRDIVIESWCRNSAIPMLDIKPIKARIEPGAIIREHVSIGENAVIMMGAVLNIGAVVGEGSMVDMCAVLGGRAIVGKNCHIGAGAVLAGVIEPASATPVVIGDNVMIGANAVILEGVQVGNNAVIGAGAVVLNNVPEGSVAVGNPAKVIKCKDSKTKSKTEMIKSLRKR